jgi:hypothetical protein
MSIAFLLVNGSVGTLGSYLVFRRYQHLGLLAAGITLVVGSLASMPDERWWVMGVAAAIAVLLHRVIGDPIEA